MNIYIMLPFIVLKIDSKQDKYLSALTDDYAEQFADVEYEYSAKSKLMGKTAHYTGIKSWVYTKILPQEFRMYEGGQT